jgi:thiamine kinase-like enzyme
LIDKYFQYLDDKKLAKFNNYEFYFNNYILIKKKLENIDKDSLPCHVDNSASNFMLHKNKDLKIIDFDFCSNNDPLSDLGSFTSEVCLFKNEINPIIEEYYGLFKQNLANRCFMYSILDDLKWAIYNFIFSKISKRNHIEFKKYSNWRFLSCNQKLLNHDIGQIMVNL